MEEQDKVAIIENAINIGQDLKFDYVSRDMSVKYGKVVTPKEIKGSYLWAEHNGQIKRYLLDGIQKVEGI